MIFNLSIFIFTTFYILFLQSIFKSVKLTRKRKKFYYCEAPKIAGQQAGGFYTTMDNHSASEKAKKLKHVRVYDQLYGFIRDGVYAPGSQLPSEPDLAEQLHVSRMTLRRALALLQEDHLVKNIRGKGNFICEAPDQTVSRGMEILRHPVHNCCTHKFDDTELEFRIEPPTESITQSLGQKSAAVVIIDRWYRCGEKVSAYSLSFLPIEVISQQQIDLNNPEELKKYLEEDIYDNASDSTCTLSYTTTGNFTAIKYVLSQSSAFLLIQENIYDRNHKILVSSKHYIPVEAFKMELNSKKDEKIQEE